MIKDAVGSTWPMNLLIAEFQPGGSFIWVGRHQNTGSEYQDQIEPLHETTKFEKDFMAPSQNRILPTGISETNVYE